MAVFNYLRKEIDAKIVYYGPGLCGKTTNLQFVHQHLKPDQRGKMVSLATDEDRTLFFDFLPIELENIRGFRTRFHLYTVPGQVYYGATRRAVLMGADGVIFVADSQIERMEDNLYSLRDLEENMRHYGKKIETTPFVIQYNKRDLPNILPVEELNQKINQLNSPYFESVAVTGKGVFECLTMICRMVLKAIEAGVEARGSFGVAEAAPKAAVAEAPRVDKRIPLPEQPRVSQDITSPKSALQLEKDTARPATLRVSPDVAPPRSGLRVEKDGLRSEPSRVSPDVGLPRSGLRVEKDALRPESSRVSPDVAPPRSGLRVEKEALRSESSRVSPDVGLPRSGLRVEKDTLRSEPSRVSPDVGLPRSGLRVEKDAPSLEAPRTARIPSVAAPKPEGEASPAPGRTILSRILEKKKIESSLKLEEEQEKKIPAAAREKMRILSCGQPRVSSSNSLELPLTVEIDGLGKTLSLNLIITLEQVDEKIN